MTNCDKSLCLHHSYCYKETSDIPLATVLEYNYPGIRLHHKLSWDSHINYICNKANRLLGFLKRNLHNAPSEQTIALTIIRILLSYLGPQAIITGGVYSTERNDGLNCRTECFLRLKLAAYHCCTSYQWHFQQVIKRTPRKIKRI